LEERSPKRTNTGPLQTHLEGRRERRDDREARVGRNRDAETCSVAGVRLERKVGGQLRHTDSATAKIGRE
jgi:hypothetical protein